jgi:hypothetical protein
MTEGLDEDDLATATSIEQEVILDSMTDESQEAPVETIPDN